MKTFFFWEKMAAGKKVFAYIICAAVFFSCNTVKKDGIYQRGRIVGYKVFSNGFDLDGIDSVTLEVAARNAWQNTLSGQTTIHWKYFDQGKQQFSEATGVKENNKKVFLHPPRSGKFLFTELSSFPFIYFPPKLGDVTSGTTIISTGFGEWDGSSIKTSDTLQARLLSNEGIAVGDSVWITSGISEKTPLGRLQTKTAFHSKFGFVRVSYNFLDSNKSVELVATSAEGFPE